MTYRFPLATSSWDERELAAMQRVIESGRFTMGEEVAAFERQFAEYLGARYCVMANSGSSANLLMVAALCHSSNPALRLRPGDEVIVPAVSWSTTYYPLHQYGLRMRFVDVDLQTLNFDLQRLEEAISDRTRLVMAVNLLGNPNDFDRIRSLIGDRDIVLIEDNCESMGAEFGGRKAGTFGAMGSYSCFFSHHISTMEGGLVSTDDEELYQLLVCLRAHGWTRSLPKQNLVCSDKSDDPFEESYRFVLPGYNLRPLELSGALGQEQVRKLPALVDGRRRNASAFVDAMRAHGDIIIQQEVGASSWFGFSMVLRHGASRTRRELVSALGDLGFECRPIVAGNFAKNEVVRYFDAVVPDELPNAELVDRNGLFIGNHHYPMDEAIAALGRL